MQREKLCAINRPVGTLQYASLEKQNKNYNRARLTNSTTGKRQEIILVGLTELELILQHIQFHKGPILQGLSYDSQIELKLDIRKAFSQFSQLERRLLVRILVQGQSVEEATRRLKHSSRKWRVWYKTTALPKLRSALKDYYEEETGKIRLAA